jgi:hypothetical protein
MENVTATLHNLTFSTSIHKMLENSVITLDETLHPVGDSNMQDARELEIMM